MPGPIGYFLLMTRIFAALFAAFVLLAPAAAHASAAGELARLLDDHARADRMLYPSNAMERGEEVSPDRYEEDLTAAHLAERRRINGVERGRLAAIGRDELSAEDRLTYDVFAWILDDEREALAPGIAEAFQFLPIDQFFGPHLSFAREMAWRGEYPFTAAREYERAIRRMADFARWIGQAIVNMREGARRGITQPRIVIERMIPEIEALANPDLETSLFLSPVRNMPAAISGPERESIAARYRAAVAGEVIPAYAALRDFLTDEYLPMARGEAGLSAMPGGRQLYLYLVRDQTTERLSPGAIHALGLAEVARITAEMETVKAAAGFPGTLAEFREFLREDPRFKFASEAEMLAAFEGVRDRALMRLDTLFGTLPRARVEFRPIEDYAAPSKAAAEYAPPSGNGARPGIVYLNTYDLAARPTYTVEALALHEAVPGHHLQLALSASNRALPRIRRYGGFTAYVEGWALYAEGLGEELGFYRDPYSEFGRLSFDAWRASRLVIDTGIHWLGWTREEAIAYLLAHTALGETDAAAEVERYIALPGQALAYKIGQKKFSGLRARAQGELGDKFDIRRFHDAVLSGGAMPLPILEARMDHWIEEQRGESLSIAPAPGGGPN